MKSLRLTIDLDIARDFNNGRLKTVVLYFILLSAALLVFFKYLGADVGESENVFWVTIAKAALGGVLLGYLLPLEFFATHTLEVLDDQA